MKKYHLYFTGKVQGVGFRFTSHRMAQNYKISGWVRNLKDGRVEMVVEGEEGEILKFLEDLRTYFEGYIKDQELDINEMTNTYGDFRIIK